MQSAVYINKDNFLHNLNVIKKLAGKDVKIMAVVKANAYGHDISLISKLCQQSKKIDCLGVAEIEEGLLLRKQGIKLPILVLCHTSISLNLFKQAILNNLELAIYDFATANQLFKVACQLKKKVKIHLKLETGLNRLGFDISQISELKKIFALKNIEIKGVFSHLSAVERDNLKYSDKQLKRFNDFLDVLKKLNIVKKNTEIHLAASAAFFNFKNSKFNLSRLGISVYGLYPSLEIQKYCQKHEIFLKPVLSWKAKIVAVKKCCKGEAVGYGCSYQVKNPMKIAIISVGYADGLDRKLSNTGRVLVLGQYAPIIGRVAMNMTVIDVSKISKNVKIGEEVILIGRQGDKEISVDELAKLIGTINYEVVTRINWSIIRKLI